MPANAEHGDTDQLIALTSDWQKNVARDYRSAQPRDRIAITLCRWGGKPDSVSGNLSDD